MSKKWQAREFLDYKERQIRRRAQKKRKLLEDNNALTGVMAKADPEAESRLQMRILLVGTIAILCLLVYVLYARSGPTLVEGGLSIIRITGDVSLSSALKEWAPSVGDVLPDRVHVVTGANGRVELSTHVSDTTVLVFERSDLFFSELRLGHSSKDFQVDFEVMKGSSVFEFKNRDGIGILHVRTPQDVDLWGKLVYLKVIASEEKSRVIVADGYVKAEMKGEKEIIPGDRQLISTYSEPLTSARAINVIREVWTW